MKSKTRASGCMGVENTPINDAMLSFFRRLHANISL